LASILQGEDRLAEAQGVGAIEDLDDLKGDFWPDDEAIDDFIKTVREWRHEHAGDYQNISQVTVITKKGEIVVTIPHSRSQTLSCP